MKQAKLISLLQSLNKWEVRSFQKYISSPFFNSNKKIIEFFNALTIHSPAFELSLSDLHRFIHGNKKSNVQATRYLMTDLTRLLEEFMAQREFMAEEGLKKKLLLRSFHQRKIDKQFTILLNDMQSGQENRHYRDNKYFETQFKLAELSYEFSSVTDNRSAETNLQHLTDQLDHYYMGQKLKYACEIMNRKNILGSDYRQPFLQPLLSYLQKNPVLNVPSIEVYMQIYKTITTPEKENNFKNLMQVIQKHYEKFPVNELRDIYAFAQNYCIRKVNTGRTSYLRELFGIYNFILEKKIIFDDHELSHAEFKNICSIALRCDEMKWTESFITKYAKYLRKDLRRNSVSYNLARLHFARKEYRQALKLLTSVEFTDVYYHLDSKSLLLKLYYETSEIEPLYSLFSSFRIYLKRSRLISEYQRTIYTNQIRYVKKLVKINPGNKLSISKIKAEVSKNKQIADYGWLLEKTEELQ